MERGNRKLNAGCGNDYKEGWVNLDYVDNGKVDVVWDLTKLPLPFPDGYFVFIFFKDVMEHLPKEKVALLLEDFCRILVPGGRLEIITPWGITFNLHHLSWFTEHSLDALLINPPKWWGQRFRSGSKGWQSRSSRGLQYKILFHCLKVEVHPFKIPFYPINIFGQRLRWLLEKPRTG